MPVYGRVSFCSFVSPEKTREIASHVNAPYRKLLSGGGTCIEKDLIFRRERAAAEVCPKRSRTVHHHTRADDSQALF